MQSLKDLQVIACESYIALPAQFSFIGTFIQVLFFIYSFIKPIQWQSWYGRLLALLHELPALVMGGMSLAWRI